jgi:hypothetical protein
MQAEQMPQAALRVPWCVQRAGSQGTSAFVVVPARQEPAARWVQGRACPEAPAVARPVPVSQEQVRSSEEQKESVFSGPASGQPAQNAPEEAPAVEPPEEASPSAGAAEAARRVAVSQGPAFAAAVPAASLRAVERKRADARPEERREF